MAELRWRSLQMRQALLVYWLRFHESRKAIHAARRANRRLGRLTLAIEIENYSDEKTLTPLMQ